MITTFKWSIKNEQTENNCSAVYERYPVKALKKVNPNQKYMYINISLGVIVLISVQGKVQFLAEWKKQKLWKIVSVFFKGSKI